MQQRLDVRRRRRPTGTGLGKNASDGLVMGALILVVLAALAGGWGAVLLASADEDEPQRRGGFFGW